LFTSPGLKSMAVRLLADRVSEVTHVLKRRIVRGELAVGERLPSERRLCAEMRVSRSVIREALGRLASLGLVESRQGSGTRVAAPNGKAASIGYERLLQRAPERLEDLAALRVVLESEIAAQAAIHRTDEHLARLDAAQAVLKNPRRSLAAYARADGAFHAVLAEATGNPFFAVVLEPIHGLLIESRLRTLKRYGAAIASAHHERILDAVRNRDAQAARDGMCEHLSVNQRHLHELAMRPVRRVPR
jgi:DNA-binding FadR family transcriptional regulator